MTSNNPDELYYRETQNGISYSDRPTGILDLGRLIKGQPYWRNPSLPHVKKPKKIIINDWTAAAWGQNTIATTQEKLLQLIKEGFEVYLWQNGTLIPVPEEHVSCLADLKVRQAITPAYPDEIIQIAAIEHHISRDQTYLLDQHKRLHLTEHPNRSHSRHLYLSSLQTLTEKSNEETKIATLSKLIDILQKSTPVLASIIDDTAKFPAETNSLLTFLKRTHPDIPIKIRYDKIQLSGSDANQLAINGSITRPEGTLTLADLKDIRALDLSNSTINKANLKILLQEAPNLFWLNLDNCNDLPTDVYEEINHICPELRMIDCNKNITMSNLLTLPQIKHVHLFSGTQLTEQIAIKEHSLAIEYFSTSGTITFANLEQLIVASSNLQEIGLYGCQGLSDKATDTFIQSSSLKRISLFDTPISSPNLNKLLKAVPNLHILKLKWCDLSSDELFINEIDLSKLEFLSLDASNCTAHNLTKLLKAAPNLKRISIKEVTNLVLTPDLKNLIKAINKKPLPEELSQYIESGIIPKIKHELQEYKTFIPHPNNAAFKYLGFNKTKNQGMIIEKLSQYLTLTQQHVSIIPKLQDGICLALSHYFKELPPHRWDQFIKTVSTWDGRLENLNAPLRKNFDNLYHHIHSLYGGFPLISNRWQYLRYRLSSFLKQTIDNLYQNVNFLQRTLKSWHYLGNNLSSFLKTQTSLILGNPWHAITIRLRADGDWDVYDPNYVDGVRIIAPDQLEQDLHDALGSLIQVESTPLNLTPTIKDPLFFLENGGLLTLCQCSNNQSLLAQLTPVTDYSKEALEGLLLRNTSGRPAWTAGIKNTLTAPYTHALIKQFIAKNPNDWEHQLQKSMECLTPLEKHHLITQIIENNQADNSKASNPSDLVSVIRTERSSKPLYEQQLKTWDINTSTIETVPQYCQQCFAPNEIKKRLIQLSSTNEINALKYALQQYAQNIQRPIFYINSPNDLVCSSPFVEHQADGTGVIRNGPGGPLHHFLMEHKDKAPVLLVNYEQFNADDLVRFNSLLDKERYADGTPLPPNALVIGLLNINKPDCYQGADFYSRFDQVDKNPLPKELLNNALPQISVHNNEDARPSPNVINLFHASDWKERLLGRWVLQGKDLIFKEGELSKALAKEGAIEIQNGLWEDDDFIQFWQDAFLTGVISDKRMKLPPDREYSRSEGYKWSSLKSSFELANKTSAEPYILNPGCINEFFEHYVCQDNTLRCDGGLIEHIAKTATKKLHIHITRNLNLDEWARILDKCQKEKITLVAHANPGIQLPMELTGERIEPEAPTLSEWDRTPPQLGSSQIINSTDGDATIAILLKQDPNWSIIDISECKPSDLLSHIHGSVVGDPPHFNFTEYPSYLLEAMTKGKKIILKGNFSQELADELAPLLLTRKTAGTLLLISDSPTPFNYAPVHSHQVSIKEKHRLLGELTPEIKTYLEHESFSQLKARINYQSTASSNAPWAGLRHVPGGIPSFAPLDTSTSVQEAYNFNQARRTAVNTVLDREPYVFITGLSGVGKSTFVEKELCHNDEVIYHGEGKTLEWINSKTSGRKYLFIDEANLSNKKWSEFEGLFNTPPTIFINGQLHSLTSEHKVIFAGNPVSYGDERTIAPLFAQHGNAVVFTPLIPAIIYEQTLKPIFDDTPQLTTDSIIDISNHILKTYDFLCKSSTSDVLISPRELQMIALLVRSYHLRNPDANIKEITQHFSYQLAAPLVPSNQRIAFAEQFKPTSLLPQSEINNNTDFLFTPSRQPIRQQLDECLELRELRQKNQGNTTQQFGGLGGMVFEGNPGNGKSEMVIAALRARGYEEIRHFERPLSIKNPFYRMPVSMAHHDKETLLLKAFDEGAVVVIDEINSSPMMERLLNQLLMGKKPSGDLPKKPGFMVIGTQNPISMAGRRTASTALARRLTKVIVEDYPRKEAQCILEAKGVPAPEASSLIKAFETQLSYAQKNHLTPAPTFRDLLKLAEKIVRGEFKKPHHLEDLLEEKKTDCRELLTKIQLHHLGEKDTVMKIFIKQKIEDINHTYDENKINEIHQSLTTTLSNVTQSIPQTATIQDMINTFRKRADTELITLKMRKKARLIEQALLAVPLDQRHQISEGKSSETKAVLQALATDRHFWRTRKVLHEDGSVNEENAASSFKQFKTKFQDKKPKEDLPSPEKPLL
jgi:hypothetical protein